MKKEDKEPRDSQGNKHPLDIYPLFFS